MATKLENEKLTIGTGTLTPSSWSGSSTTLKDKTNGTETYVDYGRSGITTAPTWMAGWDDYCLTPVSSDCFFKPQTSYEEVIDFGYIKGAEWGAGRDIDLSYFTKYSNCVVKFHLKGSFGVPIESSGFITFNFWINVPKPPKNYIIAWPYVLGQHESGEVHYINPTRIIEGNIYNNTGDNNWEIDNSKQCRVSIPQSTYITNKDNYKFVFNMTARWGKHPFDVEIPFAIIKF